MVKPRRHPELLFPCITIPYPLVLFIAYMQSYRSIILLYPMHCFCLKLICYQMHYPFLVHPSSLPVSCSLLRVNQSLPIQNDVPYHDIRMLLIVKQGLSNFFALNELCCTCMDTELN